MAVIQVQIGQNIVDDVFLYGGLRVNIIIEQLKSKLGLLKPKPTSYNLRMVDQKINRPNLQYENIDAWDTICSDLIS